MFAEAVARTGLLTMQDVIQRARVSYKIIGKHRRAGLLKGERRLVFGKLIWMFEPAEVARYAQVAAAEAQRAKCEGRVRGGRARAIAPVGFRTVADLVRESGRTVWCIYDHIAAGTLAAAPNGLKGAYLIAEADAAAWVSTWRYLPLLEDTATIPAAAQRFGVPEATLRSAIARGDVAAHAFGDVRTQVRAGAQVGRAISRVRLGDVRELADALRKKNPPITSAGFFDGPKPISQCSGEPEA